MKRDIEKRDKKKSMLKSTGCFEHEYIEKEFWFVTHYNTLVERICEFIDDIKVYFRPRKELKVREGLSFRYYLEDVRKMQKMTGRERLLYEKQLLSSQKYIRVYHNIDRTPEWIETLKENEIFVFGCRNSGRHLDGASNFALKHFGAVMGQREGRQGQSYAIPTIGGVIGLKEIRQSVNTFTQYAAVHPELHFLVTPIGCGGGCRRPSEIAPMFRDAAKLPNVSLPKEFWDILNR